MGKHRSVSAPGKVLLTGGYLVLDRRFSGLVVAIDARFLVHVESIPLPTHQLNQPTNHTDHQTPIIVRSPQFTDGAWDLILVRNTDNNKTSVTNTVAVTRASNSAPNPFVETAIAYTMHVITAKSTAMDFDRRLGAGLKLTVLADNDFYSQSADLQRRGLDLNVTSLASLPKHNSTHGPIAKVHKTGLGSSAAMVTALVAALLCHFDIVDIPSSPSSTTDTKLVYQLAQLCHCVAQGKIGSGFDISAAVVGSHGYRRFSPVLLDDVFEASACVGISNASSTSSSTSSSSEKVEKVDHSMAAQTLCERIVETVDKNWDWQVTPFELPHGLSIVLGDVAAGSNTPKLVSKVLAWRKTQPETSERLWTDLGSLNNHVEDQMRKLAQLHRVDIDAYTRALGMCAHLPASQWRDSFGTEMDTSATLSCLVDIYESFMRIRELLRRMSDLADAPIEPSSQTRLLDACMDTPGVLMAGVPGAGGFDAIFCIVVSDAARTVLQEDVWPKWTEARVAPLLQREAVFSVLRH